MSEDGSWIPSTKPAWWSTIEKFGRDPTGFIRKEVATYLVVGVIAAIEALTGRIRWIWSIVADAVKSAGESLDYAFGNSGDVLTDALGIFPSLLETLSSELGLLAPVVVTVGGILLVYALWQGLKRAPGAVWKLYQAIPGT